MNDDPAPFWATHELAMLEHDVEVSRRLLEIEASPCPLDFGEQWHDMAEARAAFGAFPPCDWWKHPDGREAWNAPRVE